MSAYEPLRGNSVLFSPPWNLLCLRSYLHERTRHICSLIDCRLYTNLEKELCEAISTVAKPRLAVINTLSLALGQTAAVLEIIKRQFADVRTVLCGQHPSQFPNHVGDIPRVDWALTGDPEPILRNLLDFMDMEPRLRRIPGLTIPGSRMAEPAWLDDLKSLSLPDWQGVFWGAYRVGPDGMTCRMQARLSRGQTHEPSDRAYGSAYQPIRFWPMDRVAGAIQKCGHIGVNEVFFTDPPGIWTPERLTQWCHALLTVHNTQSWGFQILPTLLTDGTVENLQTTLCHRIEYIFPSCDPAILKHYGCILGPRDLSQMIDKLQNAGIHVHMRFWVGGPEERHGEAHRIIQTIRSLGFRSYSLHPFPYNLDAPIFQEHSESTATHVDDWIAWSRDPWIIKQPVPIWGGPMAVNEITARIEQIVKAVHRHPGRWIKTLAHKLLSRNWIVLAEDKAMGLLSTPPDKPA